MLSAPRPLLVRTGLTAVATLAVAGVLASCSSSPDAAPAPEPAVVDSPHGAIPPSMGAEATLDPAEFPADDADRAEITALVDAYFTTTNAQDADGLRAIVCAAALPEYADYENAGPVPDPMILENLADLAVDADVATANLTINMGENLNAPAETVPFKFAREGGEWKMCGRP